MLSLDNFGGRYTMSISKEVYYLPSIVGVIMTFFVGLVVVGYTAMKIDILINYKENKMMSIQQEAFYDDNFTMSGDQGLNLAVAFTEYGNEREISLDPSIGELVYKAY